MDAYNVIELVGEGSFGKVYKARRRFTGQIVVRLLPERGATRRASPWPVLTHAHAVAHPPPRPQAIKFIMKHGKSEKDIRALRQEIEILRSLQARARLTLPKRARLVSLL